MLPRTDTRWASADIVRRAPRRHMGRRISSAALAAGLTVTCLVPAIAGPPYQSDDPEPTEYRHYEIYTFNKGARSKGDLAGASGIDFNYGAAPNLQLTATLPVGFDFPSNGPAAFGLSNIELAAKYRILHQDTFVFDVPCFRASFCQAVPDRSAIARRLFCCRSGCRRTGANGRPLEAAVARSVPPGVRMISASMAAP